MADDKTELLRRDQYGFFFAAELASKMIAAVEGGRDGPAIRSLTIEAHDVEQWDDVVADRIDEQGRALVTNWQVKRQATALSAKAGAGLFTAAAALVKKDEGERQPTLREFRFRAATVSITVPRADDVELRKLADVCERRAPFVEGTLPLACG